MSRTSLLLGLSALLSACAESTATFDVSVENVSTAYSYLSSGAFDTPVGASAPGAIGPGGAYEFTFTAGPGSRLSFATMFVPSNDLFYAPVAAGISLYDDSGMAISGDVTSEIRLWDAGTEVNQEPGVGGDQPMRQAAADTGADESGVVQEVSDAFTYPAVADVLMVTLTPGAGYSFTVQIENVSTATTLMPSDNNDQAVPLAPGVWVVHSADNALFTPGASDSGDGLEALAEDGNPGGLAEVIAADAGLTSPLAPGVWAVHTGSDALFSAGSADRGEGLEALAEDGDPSGLNAMLEGAEDVAASGVFNTPAGGSDPAPIFPGEHYGFTVDATEGDRLSLATMLVQSNDLFLSTDGMGIELFDGDGEPIDGDLTMSLELWDAGTEVNEEPGVGGNQAPRQAGADTGADEGGVVQLVSDSGDGFDYPAVSDVIRVTITAR
jgi:hypothetical protein